MELVWCPTCNIQFDMIQYLQHVYSCCFEKCKKLKYEICFLYFTNSITPICPCANSQEPRPQNVRSESSPFKRVAAESLSNNAIINNATLYSFNYSLLEAPQ